MVRASISICYYTIQLKRLLGLQTVLLDNFVATERAEFIILRQISFGNKHKENKVHEIVAWYIPGGFPKSIFLY